MGRITPPVVNPVARSAPTAARSSRMAPRSMKARVRRATVAIMEEKSRITTEMSPTDI